MATTNTTHIAAALRYGFFTSNALTNANMSNTTLDTIQNHINVANGINILTLFVLLGFSLCISLLWQICDLRRNISLIQRLSRELAVPLQDGDVDFADDETLTYDVKTEVEIALYYDRARSAATSVRCFSVALMVLCPAILWIAVYGPVIIGEGGETAWWKVVEGNGLLVWVVWVASLGFPLLGGLGLMCVPGWVVEVGGERDGEVGEGGGEGYSDVVDGMVDDGIEDRYPDLKARRGMMALRTVEMREDMV